MTLPSTWTPSSVTVTTGATCNFSGPCGIGGTTGLLFNGTGTLFLATTNTYTGNTNVASGTLNLGNTLALQDSALVSGGVTFDASVTSNAFTLGGLSGSGSIALQNNAGSPAQIALSVGNTNASTTFSGTLSGPGCLVKIGTGTLTLTGQSTYTGGTTLAAGIINVDSSVNPGVSGPLGGSGPITFAGGTLQYSSANQFDYSSRIATTASQPIAIDTNGQNVTYATGLNGSGTSLTKLGAGTLTLSGTSGYTAGTTIGGGTLQLGISGAPPVTTTVSFTASTTLDLNNFSQTVAGLSIAKGVTATLANGTLGVGTVTFAASTASTSNLSGGSISINGGTLDASAAGNTAVADGVVENVNTQITGTGGLNIKAFGNITDNSAGNSALFTLSNTANNFTGGVNILTGLVNFTSGDGVLGNTVPTTNVVTLSPGAGLMATTSVALNTSSIVLSGAGDHYLRNYGVSTMTINGVISGTAATSALHMIDSGTTILAGANTYTGPTTVNDGTVKVTGNETAATGGWVIGSGAVYTTNVTFNAGSSIVSTGPILIGNNTPNGTLTQTLTSNTTVNNSGQLTLGRNGLLNISGSSTWNQSGGLSVLDATGSGYSAGPLTVNTGSTFNYNGSTAIVLGPAAGPSAGGLGSGTIAIAGGTFNTSQGFNDTVVSSTGGTGNGSAVLALSSGGTITLTSNVTSLTTTAGSAFVMTLGSGSGGIINTNGFNTSIGVPISNASTLGVLNKSGAGTYTGGTIVGGGTLSANNSTGSATGTGSVTLNGATFASGTVGSITGSVVAGTGSNVIAPGGIGSVGSLTVGGITTNNLTTLNFDLGAGPAISVSTNSVVTNGDLLTIGTANSIGAGTLLSFAGTPVASDDYRLIGDTNSGATVGGLTLANFSLPTAPSGLAYSLSTSVDPGFIDLVVVSSGPNTLTWNDAGGSPADGFTWDIATNQNFNNGSGASLYHEGDIVTFNDTNNYPTNPNAYSVTLNTTVHPKSVTVTTTNAYSITGTGGIADATAGPTPLTLTGTGSLTLGGSNTYTGGTTVGTGTDTPKLILSGAHAFPIGTPLTVNTGASVQIAAHTGASSNVVVVQTSTLTNSGKIDITNNSLVIASGSTVAGISSQLASGAIMSSFAASDTTYLTTIGVATGLPTFDGLTGTSTDVLVKYTYYGDANLDGAVDGSDYTLIDAGFNSAGTLTGWQNGDFNNDGVIDGSDYTLIDNAFNTQGASLGTNPLALVAGATAQIAGGTSAVPEPTTLGLVGIGAVGLIGRRRRRN